jgi:hypothetical protein
MVKLNILASLIMMLLKVSRYYIRLFPISEIFVVSTMGASLYATVSEYLIATTSYTMPGMIRN